MKRLLIQLLIVLSFLNCICLALHFIFRDKLWGFFVELMGFCSVGTFVVGIPLGLYIIAERITKE